MEGPGVLEGQDAEEYWKFYLGWKWRAQMHLLQWWSLVLPTPKWLSLAGLCPSKPTKPSRRCPFPPPGSGTSKLMLPGY